MDLIYMEWRDRAMAAGVRNWAVEDVLLREKNLVALNE